MIATKLSATSNSVCAQLWTIESIFCSYHVEAAICWMRNVRHLAALQDNLRENDATAVHSCCANLLINTLRPTASKQSAPMLTVASASEPNEWCHCERTQYMRPHALSVSHVNQELQQNRCLSISIGDCLKWWSMQNNTYVQLSQLARDIFTILFANFSSQCSYKFARPKSRKWNASQFSPRSDLATCFGNAVKSSTN